MDTLTSTDILGDIFSGKLDASLDGIKAVINERLDILKDIEARKLRFSMKVGDTVYFKDDVRPAYLAGLPVVIRKFNPKKIVVDLVKPAGSFHKGIIGPVSFLTTIKP